MLKVIEYIKVVDRRPTYNLVVMAGFGFMTFFSPLIEIFSMDWI